MTFKSRALKAITLAASTACLIIMVLLFSNSNYVDAPELPPQTFEDDANTEPTFDVEKEPNEIPTVEQAKPLINEPILFTDINYIELFDIDLINNELNTINNAILKINNALFTADFTDEARDAMITERKRLQAASDAFQHDINCYTKWETEHYYTAKIWLFLRANGYSNEVTCGIIGNMMIETCWLTLDINPHLYDKRTGTYYGICQWSNKYYPSIQGASFEKQLYFLEETIQDQFKTFGKLYYTGFTYEAFKDLTNPAEVALAFAKVYERCSSKTYDERQQAAMIAYNYFVK